ncbi:ATP-binding protein [Desulfobacterales bacterium HSG2]|nr:ATP-binding protein [Desulfobacterales bacterium HSG2]
MNPNWSDREIQNRGAKTLHLKLHYKFFTVFILNSVLIMVLLIGTLQFFIYRNFADYVNRVELSRLNSLVTALKKEYVTHNGWDSLRSDPRCWDDIVFFNLMKDRPKSGSGERGADTSDRHNRRPPRPPRYEGRRPPPRDNRDRPPPRDDRRRPPRDGRDRPPPRDDKRGPPRHDRPLDPLQIGRRLSLFDTKQEHVAGRRSRHEPHTFREIMVNGNTVGCLGLDITKDMYHPLALEYIKSQINAFYIIGCGIMALSVFLSFFISGRLLRPVRQLTKGTKALTSFRFDTKIEVRAKDELGKLAEDFNRMAETLKKYEEMRRQWISDISHELRTPLTIMRGRIEAVLDGIRELSEETMVSLHSDVIRLSKLVDDLHLLSQADSRNLRIMKTSLNPLQCLGDTLDTFRTMLADHEIKLQADIAYEEPIIMEADRDHLGRLFSNLLENTLRYTDSPGVLKIDAVRKENRLILCFEDSAPGVPDHGLKRIFDRLYRVDKSGSRKLGGSGLGLSICKQIVESHNGTIWAEHSPLGGLLIIVEFPLIS